MLAEPGAKNPRAANAATKALVHSAAANPIDIQLDAEKDAIIDCMHTDDFRVVVKKILDKGK